MRASRRFGTNVGRSRPTLKEKTLNLKLSCGLSFWITWRNSFRSAWCSYSHIRGRKSCSPSSVYQNCGGKLRRKRFVMEMQSRQIGDGNNLRRMTFSGMKTTWSSRSALDCSWKMPRACIISWIGLPGPPKHLGPNLSGGCSERICWPPRRPMNDQHLGVQFSLALVKKWTNMVPTRQVPQQAKSINNLSLPHRKGQIQRKLIDLMCKWPSG